MKRIFAVVLLVLQCSVSLYAEEDPTLRKNVAIIFDDSGSMAGFGDSRIKRAQRATAEFVARLPQTYNVGLYGLNAGYVFALQPLDEKTRQPLIDQIYALGAKGSTPIATALKKMGAELRRQQVKQAGYGSYTIVIATDGIADDPVAMFAEVDRAIESGITIKTIGIDIKRHGLREVTDFTEASSVQQLVAAMRRAVEAEVNPGTGFVAQDF